MQVCILGTKYTVIECDENKDERLKECDGYCDKTTRKIVVIKEPPNSSLGDWEQYRKKVLRHEIVHAYLFESGLHENYRHPSYGHDETIIDWIAVQFPKMLKTFQEVGCL